MVILLKFGEFYRRFCWSKVLSFSELSFSNDVILSSEDSEISALDGFAPGIEEKLRDCHYNGCIFSLAYVYRRGPATTAEFKNRCGFDMKG